MYIYIYIYIRPISVLRLWISEGLNQASSYILRGELFMFVGNYPDLLSRQISVRIVLVGRLGVSPPRGVRETGRASSLRVMRGAPRNPAPRNHFFVRIVKPSDVYTYIYIYVVYVYVYIYIYIYIYIDHSTSRVFTEDSRISQSADLPYGLVEFETSKRTVPVALHHLSIHCSVHLPLHVAAAVRSVFKISCLFLRPRLWQLET